eukprot:scaffold75982_cov65-Phaeocystis_antarctica.AAC.15
MSAALRGHAGDLTPRIERRVVGPHRAGLSITISPAHQVDPARPAAQARQWLQATDDRRQRHMQHPLPFRGQQRRPRSDRVANESLLHRRKAHVLQHRHQLGLGPLGGLPPPHDPPEYRLLVLGHQHLLLHQRQHLRARGQLRRQLLEAIKRRRHGGLLERRQGEGLGDPPHLERVLGRQLGGHHRRARGLERLDHQPCRCVQHLGQLALLDLAGALVHEGQQRLEHRCAHALERVRVARGIAHARVEQAQEVP